MYCFLCVLFYFVFVRQVYCDCLVVVCIGVSSCLLVGVFVLLFSCSAVSLRLCLFVCCLWLRFGVCLFVCSCVCLFVLFVHLSCSFVACCIVV